MRKGLRTLFCALLAACFVLSVTPIVGAEEDAIHIRTAEDLQTLAASCSLDAWSDGLLVVLDNDISLAGTEFEPIPIFNGSFDGRSHTIYDLDLDAAQSPCGLFLETGKDANIRDLHVTGTVRPQGDDSMVGGLVGLNRGVLSGCSFRGQTAAVSQVGGVAGKNEGTGVITGCKSAGTVSGLSDTGGIVGYNAGSLLDCVSGSYVNTESVDPSLRLDAIDTSSILNFLRSFTTDNAGVTTNTGGVAGRNTGFLERCRNDGTVGYLHLGYNVGGVAGRSSGYVSGCENDGEVYGRRDVGGVVGQAEPLIEVSEARNLLAGLGYRMTALNEAIDTAIEDAGGYSEELAAQLGGLSGYLSPAAQAIGGVDPADPASLEGLRSAIAGAVSGMSAELSDITRGMDGGADVLLEDMQAISDNLDALSGAAMQALSVLSGAETNADILEDESADTAADAVTFGKILSCTNEGAVYGDSNVGGVAGVISVEDELDPEKDLSSDNSLIQSRYRISAVILRSVNHGEVTAKRECAGGIVGRMDFGYVGHCASYGAVSLEDGGYAGGVSGLCYGTVGACCVKCAVSGEKYIGGVVGNGFTAGKDEERSSLVSGCYALTEIPGKPQFAGAISGGGDGVYEENYFVPAGFAGMDKLSIRGQAEPMEFEDFRQVEGLPEECTQFTLRFVVDGETVKTVPFRYGASFDRSVFPEVEKRSGAYAVWDRTDLTDLRFDTVVTADFRMDETVLRSEPVRADGRAALYVDGQFQAGDALTVESLPVDEVDFARIRGNWRQTVRRQLRSMLSGEPDYSICVSPVERLHVAFPEDGLREHTLRYLTPDGSTDNVRLYLRSGDEWLQLDPDRFGSYLTVPVPGVEAELLLVSTIQSWWIVAYIALGLLLLAAVLFLTVRLVRVLRARPKKERRAHPRLERWRAWRREHKKASRLIAAGVAAAVLITAVILSASGISNSLSTYRLLKSFAAEETDILTDVAIRTEEREITLSSTVHRILLNGKMISCAEQYGVTLYISDGTVYLENGRAFRITGNHLDQSTVMDLARKVFRSGKIEKLRQDGMLCYEARLQDETADEIIRLFLSGEYDGLIRTNGLTVDLYAADDRLQKLSFRGEAETESGVAFTLEADLTPQPMETRLQIPQEVQKAMEGEGETTQILTGDLLALVAAWMKNEDADAVDAAVSVRADCGSLDLNGDYDYSRQTVEGTEIHAIGGRLFTVYFTENAACTEQGTPLGEVEQRLLDTAKLIPIAKELCLRGQYACETEGGSRVFTIALSAEDAGEIAQSILPELQALEIRYDDCALHITVRDGNLASLEFDCGGSMKVVAREAAVSVNVIVKYGEGGSRAIPESVRAALLTD